jgi:hypothetical protein
MIETTDLTIITEEATEAATATDIQITHIVTIVTITVEVETTKMTIIEEDTKNIE